MFRLFGLCLCLFLSGFGLAGEPKRVYADMVADLFHKGHVEFLRQAKECGDYLIIGILPDSEVESYKRSPILHLEERKAVVAACRYVDEVITAPALRVTEKWLLDNRIDVVVHGDDFDQASLLDQYGAALKMGILKIVPYTKGISTSEIIERIWNRDRQSFAKLVDTEAHGS